MRIETEILMKKYKDSLFAAAYSVCRNPADADDAVQDTLIQYHTIDKQFESEQHIRAWLLRVAINKAKNITTSFWRRQSVPLEDYMETLAFETAEAGSLFEQVMKLPEKYRIVIHLFYYEDYAIREIADILHVSESSVKVRLMRGRKLLKKVLKEEWDDDDQ
ncbi:MAG: sigma-70 family RNA polymerase sigma factor [Lachnospiraceae bacterium]|nr:sigma-70 family RNA polymerase sigma factor [Lachnospiraceae bacterium]MDD3796618.1 sigma-70 family RNA polymerase sigma factor [Lachnospiraceae bacterium]